MLSPSMVCIACDDFGGADVLRLIKRPVPVPATDEVLIKVKAAGLNRADILQRQGKYPPPLGAPDILGMEVSGTIAAMGSDVKEWKKGERVCALLAGGGYAEYVCVPAGHCLVVPDNLDLSDAAALPEAIATVYATIFEGAGLMPGETVLVHGGSSGVGTMAIQMIKTIGAFCYVTAGSEEKAEFCRKLGADLAVDYKARDFVEAMQGKKIDIVLDMVGGDTINRNLQILGIKGRHVSIATQKGARAEIDIRLVMQKQLILTGSTLRGRDKAEKARLIGGIREKIWPLVASDKIKPVIFQVFPLQKAADAHKLLESGAHRGKILLEIS